MSIISSASALQTEYISFCHFIPIGAGKKYGSTPSPLPQRLMTEANLLLSLYLLKQINPYPIKMSEWISVPAPQLQPDSLLNKSHREKLMLHRRAPKTCYQERLWSLNSKRRALVTDWLGWSPRHKTADIQSNLIKALPGLLWVSRHDVRMF